MSDQQLDLETVLEADDDSFLEAFPAVVSTIEEDLEGFLFEHPEGFERLVTRVASLSDPAGAVEADRETFERFIGLVWQTLGLVTDVVPAAGEAVTEDLVVEWNCVDTGLRFHLETVADAGTVTGAGTPASDPDLTFLGDTETMVRMVGDREFDAQQAFMQGEFQIEGPLPLAVELQDMTETILSSVDDLT